MIRKLLYLFFIAFATASAIAQTHYKSNITVGAKGGADLSRIFFNPSVRQSFKIGGTVGIMFRYVEESHFGLIAELNFIQRGWKENFEGAPYNYSRTFNYIELPVLAHIYFGRRGKFFFNAGPEVAYMLSESTSANFNVDNILTLPDFPNINRTNTQMTMSRNNKIDYGITAGLGGEFNINRRNSLCIEIRFYYGLGNVFSAKRTDIFNASNQMSLLATLGYWFRIK